MKIFGIIVSLALFIWFCYLWGAQFFKSIIIGLMPAGPVLGLILVGIIILVIASMADAPLATVAAVFVFIGALVLAIISPYNSARQYVGDIKIVNSSVPSFAERAPYRVAALSSKRNLQDATGTAQATKSLAGEGENGQWNTLVIRRGVKVGYESVQSINTPLFGEVKTADVTLCKFNTNAKLRLGGAFPSNNLGRAIAQSTPWNVTFSDEDVYSYCKDKTPMVVVPLKVRSGFPFTSWNAYGVAVFNGKTNQVSIKTDSEDIAKVPGPVYPITLAAHSREAYHAVNGFLAYVQGTAGYEDTSDDENDPNGGNNADFSLNSVDGGDVSYVTPLTPRGSSTSITGISTVDNRTITSGKRNTVEIYKLSGDKARNANSSVADSIKTKYSWLPDWASGLTVFEIVPGENGSWVASIGREQSVAYRAVIDADQTITLYDSTGAEVMKANSSDVNGDDTGSTADEPTVAADSDLAKLTPKELKALAGRVLEELEKRAEAAK